jgi:hypothetical protein
VYVFVVLEVGTRRILHWNVTAHPMGEWTAQQFRMIVAGERPHRFVIHDRDTIYAEGVDRTLAAMRLTVLKTPVRAPTANAFCERLVGTTRRECLDFVIPLNERHVRSVLREWVAHYNRGRPHASLGEGIPIHRRSGLPSRRTAIVFRSVTGFCRPQSWAGYITNTDWNGLREGPAAAPALCLRTTVKEILSGPPDSRLGRVAPEISP